ncbi:tRNA pseudouridine(55) synthase TruB [Yersinia sp. 2544 StPb PI]|uniref:tRNA pseudouridine(55) synthase TruB n=1 Tax=unclassified Yersinia (in: enterobacteria) TaxID=2653513 RepID=UPI0009F407EF|nr:tRNA pseudouridine(55) synthase TruB [Yersinia enterocolitica]
MGRPRRRGRDINGVLLLDKPLGLSSNDVLQKVKRLFSANRAGHTGALDPLATGMLPICLGEATKFSQFLLDSDKRYLVVARLGQRTDTSDAEGALISEREVNVTQAQMDAALDSFRGDSQQIPSMYSALKHQGKPLYEYARQGIEVERDARSITVYELLFIRWEGNDLELEIHCSKGTYIRTIVDDLGELLGCGAHVSYLRRLQVAAYPSDRMVTLEQLTAIVEVAQAEERSPNPELDLLLLPMDSAVLNFPEVNLLPAVAAYVKQGQPVHVAGAPSEGMVRITEGEERNFIGIGTIAEDGRVAPKRLVVEAQEDAL